MTDSIAQLITATLATNLASFPEEALKECGLSPSIIEGIRAARAAFHDHVTESEIEALRRELFDEVREGLLEIDRSRRP